MLARAWERLPLLSAAPAAAAASEAWWQQRCVASSSGAAAPPTHSCILPAAGQGSLQSPLLSSGCVMMAGGLQAGGGQKQLALIISASSCRRPQYADSVWELLASYFPNRNSRPPTCISISAGPHGSPADAQLRRAGFAVPPQLLRPGEPPAAVAGDGRRACCLEEPPGVAASAAAAGRPAASKSPWKGAADVVLFSDVMDVLDTRRALQAAHRHLAREGLLAVLWTDRDQASRFVVELEELLEAAVPGGQAGQVRLAAGRAAPPPLSLRESGGRLL